MLPFPHKLALTTPFDILLLMHGLRSATLYATVEVEPCGVQEAVDCLLDDLWCREGRWQDDPLPIYTQEARDVLLASVQHSDVLTRPIQLDRSVQDAARQLAGRLTTLFNRPVAFPGQSCPA